MSADSSRDPLLRALGFLGLRGWPVARSVLLGVGGALSALGLAALSAWLITRAWQMPPILWLSLAITAVRALGISRGLFRYLERLATHDLALGAMASARERVYRALATGSPAYSVTLRRGELLTRTGDDIDEIGNALIRGLVPIAVGVTTSLAAVVIMAFVSWWAALVLAVALAVSGLVAPWLAARASARAINDGATATTAAAESATTALWHAPELVVARRRRDVLDAAARADRAALAAADRGMAWQSAAAAATPLSLGASLIAACLIGIGLASSVTGSLADVSTGEGLTPMMLGVLILLPLSAFESTAPLTEAGVQLERSRQSAARVMALIDGAHADGGVEEVPDVEVHRGPVSLQVGSLRWGWPARSAAGSADAPRADADVVESAVATPEPLGPGAGLTITLPPGSRLAVLGRSGVGKSTLMLTLAGLLGARAGSVTCVDSDGAAVDLRSAACYFAEEGHVFSTTVRENLRVARGDVTDTEIGEALAVVGLDEWVRSMPDGLDTVLTGGADAISGGQRRRLLLARALIHRAPIVLLDEPTEHLDPADAETLLRALLATDGGMFGPQRTVVVVTHQLPDALNGVEVIDLDPVSMR